MPYKDRKTVCVDLKKMCSALNLDEAEFADDIVRDGNAEYCVNILVLEKQNGKSDVGIVKQ